MKANKIAEKTEKELAKLLADLKAKVLKTKFEVASRETNNHQEIRKAKKDIARIQTILRERELAKVMEKAKEKK